MDLLYHYQYISSLILKERLQILSPGEAEELQKWLERHPHHWELYELLKQKDLSSALTAYNAIDTEKGLAEYRKRYRRHSVRYLYGAVASVVVLFIGIIILFLSERSHHWGTVEDIVSSKSKAELVLGDGSIRILGTMAEEEKIMAANVVAYHSGSRLSYKQFPDTSVLSSQLPIYNELRVPIGGEYQLELSDGTKVWLNSQSRLRYPVVFADTIRAVELTGEAYFEVAHHEQCPFCVHLREQVRVEVLGTSFNLRDYPDEETLETVLEEGCVRLVKDNDSVALIPGMKGVYAKSSGGLSTEMVDTELYTSWRNGHFVFRNDRLETILHKLSRWYEIQVFFGDEDVKDLLFSGNVKKYDTVEKLLEAISVAGGVRFEIMENRVVVYSEIKKY